jgi:hypothetical protein
MPFPMPVKQSDLTGTSTSRVTTWKEVRSKIDGGAQIEFTLTSERGTVFQLYMTVRSLNQVNVFLEAGILRKTSEDEFDVTPIPLQPSVKVTLDKGKLKGFEKVK